MFDPTARDSVLQMRAPGARWLSTGFAGGFTRADAAYNLAVPDGFDRTDLDDYVAERRRRAGFAEAGPALLTGVDVANARGARSGDVVAVATVGLSNPAALPVGPAEAADSEPPGSGHRDHDSSRHHGGTVNLLLGTTRALDDGALANLVAVAAEAKAATLLALAGVPGTTTDAVVVGADPAGDGAAFSGSGTSLGADVRACVRDSVRAALRSRYPRGDRPTTVADAEHGVRTDRRAEVFRV